LFRQPRRPGPIQLLVDKTSIYVEETTFRIRPAYQKKRSAPVSRLGATSVVAIAQSEPVSPEEDLADEYQEPLRPYWPGQLDDDDDDEDTDFLLGPCVFADNVPSTLAPSPVFPWTSSQDGEDEEDDEDEDEDRPYLSSPPVFGGDSWGAETPLTTPEFSPDGSCDDEDDHFYDHWKANAHGGG
jgi:hypothetical protein